MVETLCFGGEIFCCRWLMRTLELAHCLPKVRFCILKVRHYGSVVKHYVSEVGYYAAGVGWERWKWNNLCPIVVNATFKQIIP